MAKINRKYYLNKHYTIDEEARVLKLMPEFHLMLLEKKLPFNRGFKKVGGSSLGDFLQTDAFKSPFNAFCNIANLGLPILDEKYVNAGRVIEPMILDLIAKTSQKQVQTFNPEQYKYDYFKDKDDVIGGIPDGYIAEDQLILEIKTTGEKNYERWKKEGVPLSYHKQAAQYAYLMGVTKYAIVAAFLKDEDYLHPENFPLSKRYVKSFKFEIKLAEVEDDIAKIKQLYHDWTTSGVSPQYNLKVDADLLDWLKCENEGDWNQLAALWKAKGKYIE